MKGRIAGAPVISRIGASLPQVTPAALFGVPVVEARLRTLHRAHAVDIHLVAHPRREGHRGDTGERDRTFALVHGPAHRSVENGVDAVPGRFGRRVQHILTRVHERPVAHHEDGGVGVQLLLLEGPIGSGVRAGEDPDCRTHPCNSCEVRVCPPPIDAPDGAVRVDFGTKLGQQQGARAPHHCARVILSHRWHRRIGPLGPELADAECPKFEAIRRRVAHQLLFALLLHKQGHLPEQMSRCVPLSMPFT
eukprot:scaffold26045_cov124-Isochrysis_galbana.AAC.3